MTSATAARLGREGAGGVRRELRFVEALADAEPERAGKEGDHPHLGMLAWNDHVRVRPTSMFSEVRLSAFGH